MLASWGGYEEGAKAGETLRAVSDTQRAEVLAGDVVVFAVAPGLSEVPDACWVPLRFCCVELFLIK